VGAYASQVAFVTDGKVEGDVGGPRGAGLSGCLCQPGGAGHGRQGGGWHGRAMWCGL